MEAYVIDVLLLVIIVTTVVISAKRGFIASVLSAVAWLASSYFAVKLNGPAAQWFYDSFMEKRITETVAGRLGEDLNVAEAVNYANSLVDNIPGLVVKTAENIGIDISYLTGTFAKEKLTQDNIVDSLVQSVAEPVIISVLKAMFFFLLLIVFVIILQAVVSKISSIIKATPFKFGDGVLGGALGLVKGALLVVLISVLLNIFVGFFSDSGVAKMVSNSRIITMIAEENFVENVFKA